MRQRGLYSVAISLRAPVIDLQRRYVNQASFGQRVWVRAERVE